MDRRNVFRAGDRQQIPAADVAAVKGLDATMATGAPNSQFRVTARQIVMVDSRQSPVVVSNPSAKTLNVLVSGAGGRDQAATFTAGFIHVYATASPTATMALLGSKTAVSGGGPTLQGGHTHAAYMTTIYLSTGGQLNYVMARGAAVYYASRRTALLSGTATGITAVSLASLAPANCLTIHVDVQGLASNAGDLTLQLVSGADWYKNRTTTQRPPFFSGFVPNVNRRILYARGGSTGKTDIYVLGYTVPNGAE